MLGVQEGFQGLEDGGGFGSEVGLGEVVVDEVLMLDGKVEG